MERACDVAIIGGGPAGLEAALMLGRARRKVLVVDDGQQRNRPVRESHGFLGHDGFSPAELLQRARSQLDRYPTIECINDHVEDVAGEIERFRLRLRSRDAIAARRIVFATGMYDDLPNIPGIRDLWGKLIFVCPYCDGWEFRDRRMAVIGNERSGLELAQELWDWSHDLVVCSTKKTPTPRILREWQAAAHVELVESPPVAIQQRDGTVTIACEGGDDVTCDVIFVSAPLKQHSELPQKIGCQLTERETIHIDANNRTTVPGVFAAGDCITRYHQIVFCAASGARAAIAINEEFYEYDAQMLIQSAVTT
ncbi:MAG: NAD(P)/FAD-dependent oxidoreductase [Vulcanimicrobiaceae bacterium]